ncbi:MAG: hypothetical protein ACE5K3_00035 [bacterium]
MLSTSGVKVETLGNPESKNILQGGENVSKKSGSRGGGFCFMRNKVRRRKDLRVKGGD